MKSKINLSALIIVILFSACNQSFYSPALHQSDIAYLPKPMSSDSAKSSTYVSGALVLNEGVNLSDELTSGQLNISRANTFKNFNLAYGAFGVFGNYHNNTLKSTEPDYFSDKFFGAVGGRLSGDFSINSGGRADFRIIGFEAAYSHEFGDYANFRKTVTNEMLYSGQRVLYSDTRTSNFTAGLTSEIFFIPTNPQISLDLGYLWANLPETIMYMLTKLQMGNM